ncbi:M20 family peptidase [Oceanobacillus piezotolerans]|uniref:Peptidase M20 domain-containing protein 2 n=1 Tax=Oceanobacillus piezotolerans TaxID=2448030 RepID=A0A498D8W6_9BACI|nr:M20 family metallopeptidase [Oceanobacillus piezotolerans]RLL43627.1 M20 family peptidase [Oceanobacillus piezotolerans]
MNLAENFEETKDELIKISNHLYNNPELGDEEFESMKLLVAYLRSHHFEVETGIVDRPTAFRAEFSGDKPGPTVAFLAEYDALPGIGHGCGHNLIATMAVGAGVVLSKHIQEIGGKVVVLGTPAEETSGAKVPMAEQGTFDDIDVAMMVHPADVSSESGPMLAMDALQFDFTGKASHAAASPEEGINALDAVIQLFNGINALREHVPSDVRIHGIITEGGQAANIVPEKAVAQFYIRANERNVVDEVVKKVRNIAEGAALMTGASVAISNYELSYDNMVNNKALSDIFTKNLKSYSPHPVYPPVPATGSADMGNVSQVVPAIHPYVGLNEPGLVFHTKEFADKTITKDGETAIADAVLALAQTGYDIITDHDLLSTIKNEFENR